MPNGSRIESVSIDDPHGWHAALDGVAHGPAHRWEYNRALAHGPGPAPFLIVASNPIGRILCPFYERSWKGARDLTTPYGFSGLATRGRHEALLDDLCDYLMRASYVCAYIALHPALAEPANWFGLEPVGANSVYLVDLTPPFDVIRKRFRPNIHARIKAWRNSGARIIDDKGRLAEAFPELYRQTLERVDASQVYAFAKDTLETFLMDEHTLVLGAEQNGRIEAISVFMWTKWLGDYQFNASTADGREHSAALIVDAMARLRSLSVPVLNLGGGVSDGDGLAQFKRRFGGRRLPLVAMRKIFDRTRFERLCREAGHGADVDQGFFPPYRA